MQTLLASFHTSRLFVARELTTQWKKSREQCAALEVRGCERQHVPVKFIPLFYLLCVMCMLNLIQDSNMVQLIKCEDLKKKEMVCLTITTILLCCHIS